MLINKHTNSPTYQGISMVIPPDQISSDALIGLIEEFITREGTDYGHVDLDLSMKVDQVKHQLAKGDVVIIFDSTTESVNLMTKQQYQEWSSTT
jgi:uncharacterized protein YheU (UPF0270 family)